MWTLITGGSKGLGADLSVALAEKGYSIVVHYRHHHQAAQEIVAQCRTYGVKAEVIFGDFSTMQGSIDFTERYIAQFNQTQTLINNVGIYLVQSALKTSLEQWLSLLQVNLSTPFILSKYLAPSLIQYKGQIINIGVSGLKRQSANTYAAMYGLTKEGLWSLTRSLARELAPLGVRVNMVSPGQLEISTDLPQDISQLPMRRAARCAEVCRVVAFLMDAASEYITGQNIEVAGGLGLA